MYASKTTVAEGAHWNIVVDMLHLLRTGPNHAEECHKSRPDRPRTWELTRFTSLFSTNSLCCNPANCGLSDAKYLCTRMVSHHSKSFAIIDNHITSCRLYMVTIITTQALHISISSFMYELLDQIRFLFISLSIVTRAVYPRGSSGGEWRA